MIRVAVSTEGFTEHEAVRSIIAPYLKGRCRVALTSIMLETKRAATGRKYRGGSVAFDKMVGDLKRLIYSFDAVTTMYDYYGFRLGNDKVASPSDITRRLEAEIDSPRFRPYLQVHEFEALLFADTLATSQTLGIDGGAEKLDRIVKSHGAPEAINTSPESIPSAHLSTLLPSYDKTLHGPLALMAADMAIIRRQCPTFDAWIGWLERL